MLDRDAPAIHLVFEALHRRAAEMPGQTGAGRAAPHDLIGQEGMEIVHRIDLVAVVSAPS